MDWTPPTEDEFNNDWSTADDVLGLLVDIIEPRHKMRWLMERLKAGIILGVARTGPSPATGKTDKLVPIARSAWESWGTTGDSHFWETNGQNAIFEVYGNTRLYGGATRLRFFDVRFDPQSLSGNSPRAAPLEPEIAAPTAPAEMTGLNGPRLQNRGKAAPSDAPQAVEPDRRRIGRPTKEYWEPLLVEMMRQIWAGDLKPRRQADVQHAMAEWIVEQGHPEPKLTQLKARARLIFQVYESEQE